MDNHDVKNNSNPGKKPDSDGKQRDKKSYPVMKYAKDGILYESVLVSGIPHFIAVRDGKLLSAYEKVEEINRILLPYDGIAIEQFAFVSLDDIRHYIELAKKETLDTLLKKAKLAVAAFIDTDEPRNITVIAADIIFSYFQDRIGTAHYLFLVGEPGSGKGAVLSTFQQLGYRAVLISNATAPNLYRLLGSIEKAQVTILIDEANSIENDTFVKETLKTGYKGNGKIPRIADASSSDAKQEFYFTYCFKIIAAERLPSISKAEGLLDRCFIIQTAKGVPKLKIDNVVETGGDQKYEIIKQQLVHLRKLLFAYRLLHYNDSVPDVNLNIHGREEELCAPLIRLFRDCKAEHEIKSTLYSFIDGRRAIKADSFEAYLYERIIELLSTQKTAPYLEFSLIWETLKTLLQGKQKDGEQSMLTDKHGIISFKQVTHILTVRFHAKRNRNSSGTKRILVFDIDKLKRFKENYEIPKSIEIVPADTSDTFATLWDDKSYDDQTQNSVKTSPVNKLLETYQDGLIQDTSKVSVSYLPLIQSGGGYYWCSIHPNIRSVHKESIEHHCQYSEPEKHLQTLRKLGVNV